MRQGHERKQQYKQPEIARAETAVRGGHGATNTSLNDTGDVLGAANPPRLRNTRNASVVHVGFVRARDEEKTIVGQTLDTRVQNCARARARSPHSPPPLPP